MAKESKVVCLLLTVLLPVVVLLSWAVFGPASPFRPFLRVPAIAFSKREDLDRLYADIANFSQQVQRDEALEAARERLQWDAEEALPGWRPRPLLVARRLSVSGFAAKMHVASVHPSARPGIWRWTARTEEEFAAMYNLTQHGQQCNSTNIYVTYKQVWGLTSRMRDVQDIMFLGMMDNRTVLYGAWGEPRCPKARHTDAFMYCFFQNFSSCETHPAKNCKLSSPHCMIGADQTWQDGRLDGMFNHLLQYELYQERDWDFPIASPSICRSNKPLCPTRGQLYECREAGFPDWKRQRQIKMSILRSLLIKHVYRPSKELQETIDLLYRFMGNIPKPMLVVHARRTDKRYDFSRDRMMPQELTDNHTETLFILSRLVTAAERLSGLSFRSIYFLSDNANLTADTEALEMLSRAAKLRPPVLRTPFNVSMLLNSKFFVQGHSALDPEKRVQLNLYLMAEIFWAGQNAAYVVGNARSGVTQFMVQLLGVRFRTDPNWLGLYEDDQTLLSCLEETRDIPWIVENSNINWTSPPNISEI